MRTVLSLISAFVMAIAVVTSALAAEKTQKRIAFVVGNESYADGALPTAANDAGLIAQTLQAAGFEVVGARDLDAETLRQSYGDFLKKVTDAGPDTVAFVYLAGYGVQYGNDNYYVPIGANVSRGADIPIATIRLSDLTGPLVALNLKARFMVFDAAYKLPFKIDGPALAGGLSLADASAGSLVAYNAAPGTVAPVIKGNYGLYAQSLAAMLREGGLAPDVIFDRVRLRVNDESKGAEVPWDDPKVDAGFRFFDSGKNAPAPAATADQAAALVDKPLKDLPVQQAYTAAVARDTIESYSQFTAAYGGDPLAKRARVLLAARREAITWRRTISVDTPPAYWSYLSRYPRGPHAGDARLRLQELAAAEAPPQDYQAIAYDVPPPPPAEFVYFDQPAIYFDDPAYADYAPPPPPPDYWLPPVPAAFVDLPPPPPPVGLFFLPVPAFVPLPDYYDPPAYVYYPQNNYFYGGYGDGVPYDRRIDSNNIHQAFGGGGPHEGAREGGAGLRGAAIGAAVGAAAVALPVAALARSNALRERGITTPQQLHAARTAPGGLNALDRRGPAGAGGNRNALPGGAGHALPAPGVGAPGRVNEAVRPGAGGPQNALRGGARAGQPGAAGGAANVRNNAVRPGGGVEPGREAGPAGARNAVQERMRPQTGQRLEQHREAPRAETRRAPEPRVQPHVQARPQVEHAAPRVVAPRQEFRAPQGNPGAFGGGQRPGGFGGGAPAQRPGGFGGGGGGAPRPGGFGGGGGAPRTGGFGGGAPAARPGGFGGGGGAPHPGGFGGGGGAPHPGGFGGGGGGAPHPAPGGGAPGRPHF